MLVARTLAVLLLFGMAEQPADPFAWSQERPLVWEDFQGAPDAASRAAARTAYEIRTLMRCQTDPPAHDVRVLFMRHESWFKPTQRLERTLAHEQGHFDLGEVTARRLRAALRAIPVTCGSPSDAFKQTLADHQRRDAELQRSYDLQTIHGTDSAAQRIWQRRIAAWLSELPATGEQPVPLH